MHLQCRRPGSITGREDPLEKGMATHSNSLAWKIPWTEELGGLQSMGSQRIGYDWAANTFFLSCICTIESLCCISETNTALKINYTLTKSLKKGNTNDSNMKKNRKSEFVSNVWRSREPHAKLAGLLWSNRTPGHTRSTFPQDRSLGWVEQRLSLLGQICALQRSAVQTGLTALTFQCLTPSAFSPLPFGLLGLWAFELQPPAKGTIIAHEWACASVNTVGFWLFGHYTPSSDSPKPLSFFWQLAQWFLGHDAYQRL